MNKQELIKLFEIAGVDSTKGNAKAMIEKAPTEVSEGNEMKLHEFLIESNHIETETGIAVLQRDGSMLVDNSGYKRHLTPDQVKAAWTGAITLPNSPQDIADMKSDGVSAREVEANKPVKTDQYYDFGDELHIIPSAEEFN